jgi:hypothetical protein
MQVPTVCHILLVSLVQQLSVLSMAGRKMKVMLGCSFFSKHQQEMIR